MAGRGRLKLQVLRAYREWDPSIGRTVLRCAWCGEELSSGFDAHEYVVKRSAVPVDKQHLITVPENVVPVHHACHMRSGQTAAFTARCFEYAMSRLGAEPIGRWYVSLWQTHLLSVPRGDLELLPDWPAYLRGVVGEP
jgi:hypothetical protein